MRISRFRPSSIFNVLIFIALTGPNAAHSLGEEPGTGPQTEKRFPPLVVPAGFQATLFACDPLIEYPSVIALGPRQGSVWVAHDYMTGLGTEIIRRDEIRLVEDTEGDGYADRSTLFAEGFNSLQGLAYHSGTVYAMHAPLLTALRDTDGDGKADERRDLLTGLGLPPEKNQTRLHCANGVAVGHDGWLYLAMGDNGTDVVRPEGDRLILNGGGILRCRPEGKDLHVFAAGLRNIYDIALDEESNVFVRDNENDGGDYMIRVCHSFHGADHGYPYLYYERPAEALLPLADLGRGSSAGGVCYLESAFPSEFRGNLFFCEWGKSVVRYDRQRTGSSFAAMKEIEFAVGAASDPYGFKPTDVIVDRDGSLLVSDWCDGQRPRRGRGRIYRIAHDSQKSPSARATAEADPSDINSAIKRLDAPSYSTRVAAQDSLLGNSADGLKALRQALPRKEIGALGRLHAVWIVARESGRDALPDLFLLAESDTDARVRASAVRAIADLSDPVLVEHRLVAGRGDPAIAARLASLAKGQDLHVVQEIVVALGRLRWSDTPKWVRDNVTNPDAGLAHAIQQTLRRCENWPEVLKLLDVSEDHPIREIALRAVADRVDPTIAEGLMDRLRRDSNSEHRRQYADALTRVFKRSGAWTYWGYRPPPRPANTEAWDRSDAIEQALDRVLLDPDHGVRAATLRRMQREQIPLRLATLKQWLQEDRDAERVAAVLESLAKSAAEETRDLLTNVIQRREYSSDNRRAALSQFASGLTGASESRLLGLAEQVEDGPVMVALLTELSQRPKLDARKLMLGKLDSTAADVRAAALNACVSLKLSEASRWVPAFLKDPDNRVRLAAASAAGSLEVNDSADALLSLASDKDMAIRSASLNSLRRLRAPTAVAAAVGVLDHPTTQLAAIDYLAEFGAPEHAPAVTALVASNRSIEILSSVVHALANWESREPAGSPQRQALESAIADVQGQSGVLLRWRVAGPLEPKDAAKLLELEPRFSMVPPGARSLFASGADARIDLESFDAGPPNSIWLAVTDLSLAAPARAQFLASSNGTLQLWLNGRSAHQRAKPAAFQADSDRFEAELVKGTNRVVIQIGEVQSPAQFHVRFRPLSSSAEHERLTQYALQNTGDAARGRALFLNAEKSLCFKCHRLDETTGLAQGGNIGPNLTGVGSRFSRIHLIESILEPSRTIAPSYETITVALADGRAITGVKVAENATTLTLGDEKGSRHELSKAEIDERVPQRRSTMPDGLEKRITDREFLDLLTFLLAEKKPSER